MFLLLYFLLGQDVAASEASLLKTHEACGSENGISSSFFMSSDNREALLGRCNFPPLVNVEHLATILDKVQGQSPAVNKPRFTDTICTMRVRSVEESLGAPPEFINPRTGQLRLTDPESIEAINA